MKSWQFSLLWLLGVVTCMFFMPSLTALTIQWIIFIAGAVYLFYLRNKEHKS